jgi:hypothetical protein
MFLYEMIQHRVQTLNDSEILAAHPWCRHDLPLPPSNEIYEISRAFEPILNFVPGNLHDLIKM